MKTKMTNEQIQYAMDYAKSRAQFVYNKLPASKKGLVGVEDIAQEMVFIVVKYFDYYDPQRPFKPWVHKVINTQGEEEISNKWDEHHLQVHSHNPNEEVAAEFDEQGKAEMVVVDDNCAETQLVNSEDEHNFEAKTLVVLSEVKSLCRRFQISFNPENYVESLAAVLDMALNQISDEEFKELPATLQTKLAEYGEALSANKLRITSTGKIHSGKGIVGAIRLMVQNGIIEYKDVKESLEKQGFTAKSDSIRSCLWEEKKRAGIAKKRSRTGLIHEVRELFDYGRGITSVAEMVEALSRKNVFFRPSTVRCYVQDLRKQTGLTKA